MSYKPMKKAWKKRWVAALRSGKFAQGRSALRDEDSYCCLGVLKAVACKKPRWKTPFGGFLAYLSDNICRAVGLDNRNKAGEDASGLQRELAGMNDNGRSFKAIAAWIQKNL
jgi:hypothetical protein